MAGMQVTLPNGQTTYIGRRGRLPAGYGDNPPPPSATPLTAVVNAMLQASPLAQPAPIPLRALSTAGSKQLSQLAGFVVGWSLSETSGSAACLVKLFDGENTSGQLLAAIGLPESEGSQYVAPVPGLTVLTGLYLNVASGAFDGTVWYLPVSNQGPASAAPPLTGVPA